MKLILAFLVALYASAYLDMVTSSDTIFLDPYDYYVDCVEDPDCKNRGVWDQESCRCIEIICRPAPGCGNWTGYPACKCNQCWEEPCPDGSARQLSESCQCPEIIICPKIRGCAEVDQNTCACIACIDDTCWDRSKRDLANDCQCPPEYVCDPPKPFSENKIWLGAPDCYAICDPNLPACQNGAQRDPETCECPQIFLDPYDYYVDCVEDPDCKNRGVWDQESCRCIEIICDPAPGCGNWIGYPTCQCTQCWEEPCPDGSARQLSEFCQCPEIVCPKIRGCAEVDQNTCACIACIDDTCWDRSKRDLANDCQCPPEYVCDPPKPFPENKIWLGAPDCYAICDPNLPACQNGEQRDPETCECPQIACDMIEGCGDIDPETCACTACQEDLCWDRSSRKLEENCQCPPEYVCDPGPPFPENKIWLGAPDCYFVCDPNLPTCENGEQRDPETCECPRIDCAMLEGCGDIDPETCACTACQEDLCWDRSSRKLEENCQCPPRYECDPAWPFPENKIWLGAPDCYFVCDPNLPACENGGARDPETCECSKGSCDPEPCPFGLRWSKKKCKCVRSRKRCFPVKKL